MSFYKQLVDQSLLCMFEFALLTSSPVQVRASLVWLLLLLLLCLFPLVIDTSGMVYAFFDGLSINDSLISDFRFLPLLFFTQDRWLWLIVADVLTTMLHFDSAIFRGYLYVSITELRAYVCGLIQICHGRNFNIKSEQHILL
jgi:hypothetical protein